MLFAMVTYAVPTAETIVSGAVRGSEIRICTTLYRSYFRLHSGALTAMQLQSFEVGVVTVQYDGSLARRHTRTDDTLSTKRTTTVPST